MFDLKRFATAVLTGSLLTLAPIASHAATCTVGTCSPIVSSTGDPLTVGVPLNWNIQLIENDSGTGTFTFEASFENPNGLGGNGAVTVLQFQPLATFGFIRNLVLTFTDPSLGAFAITDANGEPIGPNPNEVRFAIPNLDQYTGTIMFELTGDAEPQSGQKPGIQMTLSAVPVPAAGLLLLTALGGLGLVRRRRKAT